MKKCPVLRAVLEKDLQKGWEIYDLLEDSELKGVILTSATPALILSDIAGFLKAKLSERLAETKISEE